MTRYVPDLFPRADRERGDAITLGMLLNHTSHLGDYVLGAFLVGPAGPVPN
ncbi:hypothetical protein [Streptomyces heilongjiangensis]|uniref:Uncharacterized protein n=1 Tax=Streptomyces heilongjiangensis TaxID=945052 RepID=A0ABW1BBK2_9ACTN